MTEFMETLYDQFIAPYAKSRPVDEFYALYFDRHEQTASLDEKDNMEMIQKFYAIHAFLLGLQMGCALTKELKEPD